jgi:hypothetical protein
VALEGPQIFEKINSPISETVRRGFVKERNASMFGLNTGITREFEIGGGVDIHASD